MPRPKVILQNLHPYNVGARCINKEWFNLPMPLVWDILCTELTRCHHDFDLVIHSFLLMSNHYHLIVSTPRSNISQCMQSFAQRTSRRLTKTGNRINGTFAGRHFKCILHRNDYFLNTYKYNYRNPVTANMCLRVEDYPYSTLRSLLRRDECALPLAKDVRFEADPEAALTWLNQRPDPKKLEAVRAGLKRAYFTPKRDINSGRPLLEDDELI